jgi:hypothetical protein
MSYTLRDLAYQAIFVRLFKSVHKTSNYHIHFMYNACVCVCNMHPYFGIETLKKNKYLYITCFKINIIYAVERNDIIA